MPTPSTSTTHESPRSAAVFGRTLAFALGSFTLLNSAGELVREEFDANLWWLHPPGLGSTTSALFFAVTGVTLCVVAVRPPRNRTAGRIARGFVAVITGIALINVATYYHRLSDASVRSSFPIPFSLIIAVSMLFVLPALRAQSLSPWRWRHRLASLILLVSLALFFPLAQMVCFGKTDYRRSCEAALVFGCKVESDGQPSLPLYDRTRTAIELYNEGLVSQLFFSGGPGPGDVHETDAMRTMAITSGIPESAIVIDRKGLDTWTTVRNACAWLDENDMERVIAVSHFYHLPRIKMTFHRRGREAYTVPASETRPLERIRFFMLREVAAFWVYYLRPLVE